MDLLLEAGANVDASARKAFERLEDNQIKEMIEENLSVICMHLAGLLCIGIR